MKITAITASNLPPIDNLSISEMESIVIIAGTNGSGKSRLKQAIVQTFQNPGGPQLDLTIQATRIAEERTRWGNDRIEIRRNVVVDE